MGNTHITYFMSCQHVIWKKLHVVKYDGLRTESESFELFSASRNAYNVQLAQCLAISNDKKYNFEFGATGPSIGECNATS